MKKFTIQNVEVRDNIKKCKGNCVVLDIKAIAKTEFISYLYGCKAQIINDALAQLNCSVSFKNPPKNLLSLEFQTATGESIACKGFMNKASLDIDELKISFDLPDQVSKLGELTEIIKENSTLTIGFIQNRFEEDASNET